MPKLCPLCSDRLHPEPVQVGPAYFCPNQHGGVQAAVTSWAMCWAPCLGCKQEVVWAVNREGAEVLVQPTHWTPPVAVEVPAQHREAFQEAARVLAVSPKASAALSRRLLEMLLGEQGYMAQSLIRRINDFLAGDRGISPELHLLIDRVRLIGNNAAHAGPPGEIRDVAPEEAQAVLEVLVLVFDHFYARPARIADRAARLGLNPP